MDLWTRLQKTYERDTGLERVQQPRGYSWKTGHPRGRCGTNDSWRRERTEAQRTGGPGRWGGLRTLPDKLQLKASARWEGAGLLPGQGSAHKASAQDRPSQQAEKLTAARRDRDVAGPRPAVRVPRQDAKRPRQRDRLTCVTRTGRRPRRKLGPHW